MICRLSTKRSQQIMNSMLHFQNMKSWHGPRIILTLLMLCLSMVFYAQDNDFGLWYSVGVEKKIDKRWSVDVEGEFRTRNHARTADRWSVGGSADYKIKKRLKGSAGYDFLWDIFPVNSFNILSLPKFFSYFLAVFNYFLTVSSCFLTVF